MSEEMLQTIALAVEMVEKNGGAIYCLDNDTGNQVKVSNNISQGCRTVIEISPN